METSFQKVSEAKASNEDLVTNFVEMFAEANITLEKADNTAVRRFLPKHAQGSGNIHNADYLQTH